MSGHDRPEVVEDLFYVILDQEVTGILEPHGTASGRVSIQCSACVGGSDSVVHGPLADST
jgi:hypothetical protein